jgi:hypothetical protein
MSWVERIVVRDIARRREDQRLAKERRDERFAQLKPKPRRQEATLRLICSRTG